MRAVQQRQKAETRKEPYNDMCLTEVLEAFILVVAVRHAVVSGHADRLPLNAGHIGTGRHHPAPPSTQQPGKGSIVVSCCPWRGGTFTPALV